MPGPDPFVSPLRSVDGWAALLSSLCLVHCLALPVGAALLPALAGLGDGHSQLTHWLLLGLAMPFSLAALWHGWRRHHVRRWAVLALGGLALMAAGASIHGWAEQALTVGGGLLVAMAHWRNWRLLRTANRTPGDASL